MVKKEGDYLSISNWRPAVFARADSVYLVHVGISKKIALRRLKKRVPQDL